MTLLCNGFQILTIGRIDMQCFSRSVSAIFIMLICLTTFSWRAAAQENGEYIAIRKEGSGNIALVLNKLDVRGQGNAGAQRLDTIIHDGLDFTGIFALISPPLNIKSNSDGEHAVINFGVLDSVAAEVYAGGTLTTKSTTLNLDMEVYDISGAKLLFKKTYRGKDPRALGYAFCADLVENLTGKRSIFGSKIVFISTKTGNKEIYECDFDGQGVEQLTSSHSIIMTPALSPDGRYLAYTDFISGAPVLSIRNLLDKKTVAVARSGVGIDPGWRSSSEVATTLSFEGDQEIYLIKTNGVISSRLTNSPGIDISPTFSPDGSQMAYVSARNGQPQIFIQDMHSGQARRLTFSGNYNTQPSWSPNEDKIAFTMWENGGELNIFVVNVDGSGLVKLTGNSGNNESPSWSPDGQMIVFTSSRQGSKKLYTMNVTGKNQRQLLSMGGEQMQPFWSLFRK